MSDIMEGRSVELENDGEEEQSRSHQRRVEDVMSRGNAGRASERHNNAHGVLCYNCDGRGHLARECEKHKKPRKCHRCQEEGHLIRD